MRHDHVGWLKTSQVNSVEKEHSELERPVDGGHRAGLGTGKLLAAWEPV